MENVGWEETSDLSAGHRIYRDHKTGSLVDAFVIDLCIRSGKTIFTFDKDQEATVKRLRP